MRQRRICQLPAPAVHPTHVGRAVLVTCVLAAAASTAAAQEWAPLESEHVARLQDAVLARNAMLVSARATVDAARARADAAGLAPAMVLAGEIEDVPDGYDVGSAVIRVELAREFMTGGRTAASRALASADVALAEARLEAIERRVRAEVLLELTRLTSARAIARRLAAEDTLLLGAEAALRDRFSVGDARYVDVLRLGAERLRVQTDRAAIVADEHAAREALAALSDVSDRDVVLALADSALGADPVATAATFPPAPAIDSLLALSAPVVRASAEVDRAVAAQSLGVANQRMRFAGSIGVQRTIEQDGGSAFGPVVGASLTLPFTAGRANRGERRAVEREVAAARAARDAVVARVRGVLAGVAARYEAARSRLAVYDVALLRAVDEERESALAGYRAGQLSLIELIDFERAIARAEIEWLRAHADAVEAYANLIAATAEGPDADGE
ncbi:MAG: TolC family protein [Longimicrobiales bacterium]